MTRFQKLVTGEVAIGTLILIWVGVFTSLPPPQLNTSPTGFHQVTNVDDLQVLQANLVNPIPIRSLWMGRRNRSFRMDNGRACRRMENGLLT